MKIKIFFIALGSLLSVDMLFSQATVKKYKNSCLISDSLKSIQETGNIYVGNSFLLTNVNDSMWMIDLKNCSKIRSYNGNIVSPTNNSNYAYAQTDSRYFNGTKFFFNDSFYFFFVRENNEQWFVRYSLNVGFEKVCKVEGIIEDFFENGNDVIAVVQTTTGNFFNNGSEVPTSITTGLIKFTKTGYLKKQLPIYTYCSVNGGYAYYPLGLRSITQHKNSIYIIFRSRNTHYNQEWGIEINGIKYKFDGNEYRLAKLSSNFDLIKQISLQGIVNEMVIKNDSLILYGSSDNLKILNINSVLRPFDKYFHFKVTVDTNINNVGSICVFNGNKGIGNESSMCRIIGDNLFYFTFSGSIFGDRIYTSAGDMAILIGKDSNFYKCEPNDYTLITSLDVIRATFTSVDPNSQIMGICHKDFFINDSRYNKALGNYYFYVKNGRINTFDSLKTTLNSNLLSKELTKIRLFPNPVDNVLNINCAKKMDLNYNIFSLDGKVVISGMLNENDREISMNLLKSGFYFIAFFDRLGNVIYRNKFIKK